MTSIAIRFLAGRFHATPWGHNVNEGVTEWPPSPWRILRALVSASYRLDPAPDRVAVQSLLVDTLGGLPAFRLPPATGSHTRHFVDSKGAKRAKILDAFVAVGAGAGAFDGVEASNAGGRDSPDTDPADASELVVAWPGVDLDPEQRALLDRILAALPYLGRAESWVEARRLETDPSDLDARPRADAEARIGAEEVTLLALDSQSGFQAWRDELAGAGKKVARHAPKDRWDALVVDTSALQSARWSDPPGSVWVDYVASRPLFAPGVRPPRRRAVVPTHVWYEILGPVRPRATEALRVGELFRRAAMSRSRRQRRASLGDAAHAAAVFSGKDDDGTPLRTHHAHAYFLPVDADNDGYLDHLLACSHAGFDSADVEVLRSVEWIWSRRGEADLSVNVAVLDVGLDVPASAPRAVGAGPVLLRTSRAWRSATPFVLSRHPKRTRRGAPRLRESGVQIDGPEDQLLRALDQHGIRTAVKSVEPHEGSTPWHRFRRRRSGGGRRFGRDAYGFRIEFETAVSGPIAVGYGAHQGLGLFVPD